MERSTRNPSSICRENLLNVPLIDNPQSLNIPLETIENKRAELMRRCDEYYGRLQLELNDVNETRIITYCSILVELKKNIESQDERSLKKTDDGLITFWEKLRTTLTRTSSELANLTSSNRLQDDNNERRNDSNNSIRTHSRNRRAISNSIEDRVPENDDTNPIIIDDSSPRSTMDYINPRTIVDLDQLSASLRMRTETASTNHRRISSEISNNTSSLMDIPNEYSANSSESNVAVRSNGNPSLPMTGTSLTSVPPMNGRLSDYLAQFVRENSTEMNFSTRDPRLLRREVTSRPPGERSPFVSPPNLVSSVAKIPVIPTTTPSLNSRERILPTSASSSNVTNTNSKTKNLPASVPGDASIFVPPQSSFDRFVSPPNLVSSVAKLSVIPTTTPGLNSRERILPTSSSSSNGTNTNSKTKNLSASVPGGASIFVPPHRSAQDKSLPSLSAPPRSNLKEKLREGINTYYEVGNESVIKSSLKTLKPNSRADSSPSNVVSPIENFSTKSPIDSTSKLSKPTILPTTQSKPVVIPRNNGAQMKQPDPLKCQSISHQSGNHPRPPSSIKYNNKPNSQYRPQPVNSSIVSNASNQRHRNWSKPGPSGIDKSQRSKTGPFGIDKSQWSTPGPSGIDKSQSNRKVERRGSDSSSDETKIQSPLDNIYQPMIKPQTGEGYGCRNGYRIPKKKTSPYQPMKTKKSIEKNLPNKSKEKTPCAVSKNTNLDADVRSLAKIKHRVQHTPKLAPESQKMPKKAITSSDEDMKNNKNVNISQNRKKKKKASSSSPSASNNRTNVAVTFANRKKVSKPLESSDEECEDNHSTRYAEEKERDELRRTSSEVSSTTEDIEEVKNAIILSANDSIERQESSHEDVSSVFNVTVVENQPTKSLQFDGSSSSTFKEEATQPAPKVESTSTTDVTVGSTTEKSAAQSQLIPTVTAIDSEEVRKRALFVSLLRKESSLEKILENTIKHDEIKIEYSETIDINEETQSQVNVKTSEPRKRKSNGKRELKALHHDLELMNQTRKNYIYTGASKRRCVLDNNVFASTSTNNTDVMQMESVGKRVGKQVGKRKRSNDNQAVPSIKRKPCPLSVKRKLYGDEAVVDHDTQLPRVYVILRRVAVPYVHKKMDDEGDDEPANRSFSSTTNSSISTASTEYGSYEIVSNSEYGDENDSTTSTSESSKERRRSDGSATKLILKKVNPATTSQQQIVPETGRRPRGRPRGRTLGKCTRESQSLQTPASDDEQNRKVTAVATTMSDVTELKQVVAATTTTMSDVTELNDGKLVTERIDNLPECNAFVENVNNVSLASISVELRGDNLLYKCGENDCEFDTYDGKMMAQHVDCMHKKVRWNGVCERCGDWEAKSDLVGALAHLMRRHLIVKREETPPPTTTVPPENKSIQEDGEKDEENNATTSAKMITTTRKPSTVAVPTSETTKSVGDIISDFVSDEMKNTTTSAKMITTTRKPSTVAVPTSETTKSVGDIISDFVSDEMKNTTTRKDTTTNEAATRTESIIANNAPVENTGSSRILNEVETVTVVENVITTSVPDETEDISITLRKSSPTVLSHERANIETVPLVTPASDPALDLNDSRVDVEQEKLDAVESINKEIEVPFLRIATSFSKTITAVSQEAPVPVAEPSISSATSITVPKLRVARLEGDRLSGPSTRHAGAKLVETNATSILEPSTMEEDEAESEPSFLQITQVQTKDMNANVESLPIVKKTFIQSNVSKVKLMQLFKCGACESNFATDSMKEFVHHLTGHKSKKNRSKKIAPTYFKCIYCQEDSETPELLAQHVLIKHKCCNFQCPYCVFRACRPAYVLWHLKQKHADMSAEIYVSSTKDNLSHMIEISKRLQNRELLQLRCSGACNFKTRSLSEFTKHLQNECSKIDILLCAECDSHCVKVDQLIKHYNVQHSVNEFQCVYCKRGLATKEAMQSHLLQDHSSLFPVAICRGECSNESGRYGNEVKFDIEWENAKNYIKLIDKNDDKSNDNASSTVESSTDINSSAVGVVQMINQCSNPVIVNRGGGRKSAGNDFVIGLSGKDLYKCGMTDCTAAVDDYNEFKDHTSACDNARFTQMVKCVHCDQKFKQNFTFFAHMSSHGIPRFYCTLCEFKFTSPKKVTDHMKSHKVLKTKLLPADPTKNNQNADIYLIVPDVISEDGENTTKTTFPEFVPIRYRFRCGATDCEYVSQDASGLKNHFETLHREVEEFKCPHCSVAIRVSHLHSHFRYHGCKLYKCSYCEYCHFSLKKVTIHANEKHSDKKPDHQTLRELDSAEDDRELNTVTTTIGQSNAVKPVETNQWRCHLCKMISTSEHQIRLHCEANHRLNDKFKCSLCAFTGHEEQQVLEHMRVNHQNVSQVVIRVYSEVIEDISKSTSSGIECDESRRSSTTSETMAKSSSSVVESESNEENSVSYVTPLTNPYPNGYFSCGKCEFRTQNLEEMRGHVNKEIDYPRYSCSTCGELGYWIEGIRQHLAQHRKSTGGKTGKEPSFTVITRDKDIEERVENILTFQLNKMKQNEYSNGSGDGGGSGCVDGIVTSSADENSNSRKTSIDSSMSTTISDVEGLPTIKSIPITSSPLKRPSTSPRRIDEPSTSSVDSIIPAVVPPKRRRIKETRTASSYKGEPIKCKLCGAKFDKPGLLEKHTQTCYCTNCKPIESNAILFAQHKLAFHDVFACLYCAKSFVGETRYVSHINDTLECESRNEPNTICVPAIEKRVLLMCSYCSQGELTNTTNDGLYYAYEKMKAHLTMVHNDSTANVDVRMDGVNRRALIGREISLLRARLHRTAPRNTNVVTTKPAAPPPPPLVF